MKNFFKKNAGAAIGQNQTGRNPGDGRGFALLFAVLVSTLVLALGAGIANITLKEVNLSGTGRESQFAFYAADTGAECALYWDFHVNDFFATSSDSYNDGAYIAPGSPATPYMCVGEDIVTGSSTAGSPAWNDPSLDADISSSPTSATTTFEIRFPEGSCSIVAVGKNDSNDDGVSDQTVIDARGYNTCTTTPGTFRVERGLQISY